MGWLGIAHGGVRIGKKGGWAESWDSPASTERTEMGTTEQLPEGGDGGTSRTPGGEGTAKRKQWLTARGMSFGEAG